VRFHHKNMSITELAKPIGYAAAIVENGNMVGSQWVERQFKPLYDTDIAAMPLAQRTERVAQMQKAYWEGLLRKDFPDLFAEDRLDSIRLALTLTDFELKEKEAESQKPGSEKLRDTVIDIFIKDFFLNSGGLKRLLLAAHDVTYSTSFTMSNIEYLTRKAAQRLRKLQGKDYFDFFAYKDKPHNLTSPNNADVLRQNIESAFDSKENKSPLQLAVSDASMALVDFYWKNMRFLENSREETPMLALIYDLLFAGSTTFNPETTLKVSDWILEKLEHKKSKEQFIKELNKCFAFSISDASRLSQRLDRMIINGVYGDFDSMTTNLKPEDMARFLEENEDRYIIGKYYDRLVSFESAFAFLEQYGRPNLYEKEAKLWKRGLDAKTSRGRQISLGLADRLTNRQEDERRAMIWRKVIGLYDPGHYALDGPISCLLDKQAFVRRTAQLGGARARTIYSRTTTQENITSGVYDNIPPEARIVSLTNALLMAMFTDYAPDDMSATMTQVVENDGLWGKILYGNKWFVASNGDSFLSAQDPQLANFNLRSLTIHPDRKRHGGYKVTFVTNFVDFYRKPVKFVLFINGDGRMYYEDRKPVLVPYWLSSELRKHIYDRLEFITSGKSAGMEDQVVKKVRPEAGVSGTEPKAGMHRRSAYRILTSGEGVNYTLSSPQAREHAKKVRELFGVDIYQTNLERRLAGTLTENQVVTIDMGIENPEALPNRIKYA